MPTRMIGTPGAWWEISGHHLYLTFSNEAGEWIEKQQRNMSVWGYERGLSLS